MGAKQEIIRQWIREGRTVLGIELGSTRIKAVLIGADHSPIAAGNHDWENRLEDGVWTYTLEDIWGGLQDAYRKLSADVKDKYGEILEKPGAIGISAMMHGYMVFDRGGKLLVPFRDDWGGFPEADGVVSVSDSPALEHCPSVSGNFKGRGACAAD